MSWNDKDDANWSQFEIDAISYLDGRRTTMPGRDMFKDLLRGGKARVCAHGFDFNALEESKSNARRFIDFASDRAGGESISPEHLDASLRSVYPLFPIC